jgi:uncharacterized membrane protein
VKPHVVWIYLGVAIILFASIIDWIASLASWDWPSDDLPFVWAFIGVGIAWAAHVRFVRWEERERCRKQRLWDELREKDEDDEGVRSDPLAPGP